MIAILATYLVAGQLVTVQIVDSSQEQITMSGCMGLQGLASAIHYRDEHLPGAEVKAWKCRIGNRLPLKEGDA